ncbi:kinase-like domain-containing protein [Pisolithus marmoratus]|nr:kinase-like domain-containing protein [Pisolithus marmoratus]
MLPAGTILHKGFYDLLAMIPTPSPSGQLWGSASIQYSSKPVTGARYEEISPKNNANFSQVLPSFFPFKKTRKINKDMVPTPPVSHLVHASDADQAEALLTRWGPDGVGKLGDPRWASFIKTPINEVVNALKPSVDSAAGNQQSPLRVVNDSSVNSALTTAAMENVHISLTENLDVAGTSTNPCSGTLRAHLKVLERDGADSTIVGSFFSCDYRKRAITPSLATLEKAVSARIYFENLYFPLLRQPPSREQRRDRNGEGYDCHESQRKVDATAFIKLKTIGHGAFGVVSLVKERATGRLFAMKQLRKTDMLRKGQEGHVRAERDILKSASLVPSPGGAEWIVKLYYSFQDRDNLYLILEYMGGGDLLNLLIERDVFDENFTRFYVAEMVLAIESCHKHGFIHRDIKPDNFLFDPEGHIRLSDFGLATDLHWAHDTSYYEQQRRHILHTYGIDLDDGSGPLDGTKTSAWIRMKSNCSWTARRFLMASIVPTRRCGTNSYMSPEVIRGNGYSFSCDWWSLGVIIFECLYGYPPFVSRSRHVTRQKILNWKDTLKFPPRPHVSHEGIDLMQQLLCEPEDRLGSQNTAYMFRPDARATHARRSGFLSHPSHAGDGAQLIMAHPWFRGIDWEHIQKYPAPYRPELLNPEDTRHFDSEIPPEPLAPANGVLADSTKDPLLRDRIHGEEILNVRKALAFAGFTHKSPPAITYTRADRAFESPANACGREPHGRGRSRFRNVHVSSTGRAISL